MKRILLASASIVAFAGAAAADGHLGVTFSGEADLGYNDDPLGDNEGFYSELSVSIGFAAELDNGLTAAASIDFDDLADGNNTNGADYELSLTSADSGLYYGDTSFAAENVWVSAGDMAADSFSEADGEEVLRAEASFGGVSGQLSYALSNADGTRVGTVSSSDLDQMSLALSGDFGNVNVVAAYQEASGVVDGAHNGSNGDFNEGEVFGLSVGTSFAGADVRIAYAMTDDNVGDGSGVEETSTGISVSYPVGPVTVDASYAINDVADDRWDLGVSYEDGPIAVSLSIDESEEIGVEGSYDVGNGLMVYAGFITDDNTDMGSRYYVAGEYDLGSGASLLVSFAEDDDDADEDEIGAQEYQRGTTVELSFEF